MKQYQKTRRARLFTLAALLVVLMSNVYMGRAQEPLKLKWTKTGMAFEKICKPGKLIITSNLDMTNFLIDLTNGEIIYQTNPKTELGLSTNYFGDKFYIYDEIEMRSKEFDVKTKEFLGYPTCVPQSPDNAIAYFNKNDNTLHFYVCGNSSKNDSNKIPNTPETKIFNHWSGEFSHDGKYFALTLWTNTYPQVPYFYLYDRQSKEFLIQQKTYFKYCLFNNSNKIAYTENMKMDGDDTIYSYIRIFDPDQRKVVQDFKTGKESILYLVLRSDDKYIIFQSDDGTNLKMFLNLEINKIANYKAVIPKIIYADETMLYCIGGDLDGYSFDWTVGVNDISNNEDSIIYPNPTNNFIIVNVQNEYFNGNWNIADTTGKILNRGIILPHSTLQIDMTMMLTGNYFLTLSKDNLLKSYKIVKR